MPDTPSIVIVKQFTYRGQGEQWSNKYHFNGTLPVDYAAWVALAQAIITAEKACLTANTTFVKAYGYEPGNEDSVAQIDFSLAPLTVVGGTFSQAGTVPAPGDAAMVVRWWTGASKKGKKIYCRKFFHDARFVGTVPDTLAPTQAAALATYAAKMIDGTLPGSFRYCGPQGASLSNPFVSPWITTRTLKRRGKRPPTSGSSA